MRAEEIRAIIASVYPGDEWKTKVRDMHECQLISVYNSFLARGLIGRVVEYTPPKGIYRLTEITDDGLITAFDEAIRQSKTEQIKLKI